MKKWPLALACLAIGGLVGTLVTDRMLQGQVTPGATPRELTSYREVVKKVLPAIVSIEAKVQPVRGKQPAQPRRKSRFGDMPIPDEMRRYLEELEERRGNQEDVPQDGFGSGFLVDPKGVVLTNYHVIAGAKQVEIRLIDGRKFTSSDIKGDRKTDLAIVRIPNQTALPFLELGDSDTMEIGDRVLAAGAPFGLTGSVTQGIVSAKGRSNLKMNTYEDFIQTDAAINPGNSGGPLVNIEGKVIGINSAIKTRTGGFQGVGLAIASNLAKSVMLQLLEGGSVRRGYLGVEFGDLNGEVAARLGVKSTSGVLVARVLDDKPAAKAGMQPGDVITSIAGKTMRDGQELRKQVASLPLGKPVEVTVVRDGKPRTLAVTIEEQPEDFGTVGPLRSVPRTKPADELSVAKIGIGIADLSEELVEQYGLKEGTHGALVTEVQPNSPASTAGLRRGMVLLRIDKKAVTSATNARDMLDKSGLEQGVLLQVQTPDGRTEFVLVKSSE